MKEKALPEAAAKDMQEWECWINESCLQSKCFYRMTNVTFVCLSSDITPGNRDESPPTCGISNLIPQKEHRENEEYKKQSLGLEQ